MRLDETTQTTMADYTVDEIVQKALTLGILEPGQLQDVWTSFGTQNIEVEPFLQALLRQGHLTKYQVDRLASGESTGFYFGEYKVLYPVGAGSFARVYRAVHPKNDKVVAIKVLRSRYGSDPSAVDLFVREAELGMGFRHPNIVPVYEVHSEKNVHFMVMDFIEGQTLREFTNIRKKVDAKVATRIVTDICLGLDYAFKRGHLHRDLKMTNVLISSSGKSLLVDFGLASSDSETGPDRKNQRAIDYAALERSTGVRRDDKRSDVFFLGTIYYHMLTGFPPLAESRDRAKRLDKTRFMNIKPISERDPSVPFAISFIVDKAMNLDPEKRYQSPGAMLVDLEVAVKKIEAGTAGDDPRANRLANASSLSLAHVARRENQVATVMIVEANPEMQNVFRESLKKIGYRVLLLSNAERAVERFEEHDHAIECVLFNAQSLGPRAVAAFNELGNSKLTEDVPAILLLDENQIKWAAKAKRARHRVAVGMPITMKRLQEVLHKLISDKKRAEMAAKTTAESIAPSEIGLRGASSLSNPILSSPTASRLSLQEDSSSADVGQTTTNSGFLEPAESHISLSEGDEDPDYIAYIQGGGGGSMTRSGEFTNALFDAALDNAVDSIADKVNAMMGQSAQKNSDPHLSPESFLNAKPNAAPEANSDSPDKPSEEESEQVDYTEDDDL